MVEVVRRGDRWIVGRRRSLRWAERAGVAAAAFEELRAATRHHGGRIAGYPLTWLPDLDPAQPLPDGPVAVVFALPVLNPFAAPRPLKVDRLPGGTLAVAVHAGDPATVGHTYDTLRAWVAAEGRDPAPGPVETHLSLPGPSVPERSVRTEVAWRLVDPTRR